MKRKIRKVAVLGAGVMGSGIAAHLANVGIPCVMLDIVPPFLTDDQKKDKKKRDMFAAEALKKTAKSKPALFYRSDLASLVETGNLEDDFQKIADCDWIIEVVKEDMAIKQALFKRVQEVRKTGCIVSSNTSGLSIDGMTEGLTEEFKQNFLVTHFFNPVRYMKLLELVVGPKTDPEVTRTIADFGENVLGKGIVYGKDTPNFVANRIGVHAVMATLKIMEEMGMTPEEVDAIAGPAMGRPGTAAFKTIDLVGLDTFAAVSMNVYNNCPKDEVRDLFKIPAYIQAMLDKKLLGNKTKAGFYSKKVVDGKKEKMALNLKTLEYEPRAKPKFESVDKAKGEETLTAKMKKLLGGNDKASLFAWKSLVASFQYVSNRMGEIADDVVNMDRGMKWGFNWEMGPFEVWDALGVASTVERMKAEGIPVPAVAKKVLEKGEGSFYKDVEGVTYYFDFLTEKYLPVPKRSTWLSLNTYKKLGSVVETNESATLHDLGDGCLGLEFHSKMNSIDDGIVAAMYRGIELLEDKFDGLVIYNEGQHFSVGANLMLIAMYASQKKYDKIEEIVDKFEKVNDLMHRAPKATVAAPHSLVLGGGCEVCLGTTAVVAAAETYIGLVEVGVGLIPGGGGCKEMLVRWMDLTSDEIPTVSMLPYMQKAFELIGMAKVATSAKEAEAYRILRPGIDKVVVSRENQLHVAKQYALGLSRADFRPAPEKMIKVAGRDGIALVEAGLYSFGLSGWVSEYDKFIARKLGYVLSGGEVNPGTLVSESRILELEKEAFMSLLGEQKTMDRIRYMLMNNKPLRN